MRYRVESNVTREPASQWFDHDPVGLCAALNMEAHRQGRGGEFGVYDENGERVP